jgi:hypothetical protein
MAGRLQLAIKAATMSCLARCASSNSPLVCLSDFLENLAAMGWNAEDRQSVEQACLKELGQIRQPNAVMPNWPDVTPSSPRPAS